MLRTSIRSIPAGVRSSRMSPSRAHQCYGRYPTYLATIEIGLVEPHVVETVEYRAQLRECVEGAMCSLRKFEALLLSEHTFDEPVQLFSAISAMRTRPSLVAGTSTRTNRNGAVLSGCRASPFHRPITRVRNSSFMASRLSNSGNSPPHNAFTASRGDAGVTGEAMSPRNRVERYGAPMVGEEGSNLFPVISRFGRFNSRFVTTL
jgi:hypothetical protein